MLPNCFQSMSSIVVSSKPVNDKFRCCRNVRTDLRKGIVYLLVPCQKYSLQYVRLQLLLKQKDLLTKKRQGKYQSEWHVKLIVSSSIFRYDANLELARSVGVKKSITTNISLGVSQFLIFGSYALAFWYGTKLTAEEKENYDIGHVLIVSIAMQL